MKSISPLELSRKLAGGEPALLLDVRTPCEHQALHARGVVLEPLESLDPERVARQLAGSPKTVYIFCQTGGRAKQAIGRLEASGVMDCVSVEGGTLAWERAGLGVERGETKVMSLERQVRIAAGVLVLTGVLLGAFLHPGFLALSGFVGAGLIFAGVTDRCGMALLLARMPWNHVAAACCVSKSA